MPQIEVTFDIDANGIVNVSAKDSATGKEQQIRIQASGGLSDDDIDAMVKDAEANAEEDKKRREMAEARNSAEAIVHKAESDLAEHGDKIDEDTKTTIETALTEVKDTMADENADAAGITDKVQVLTAALMKMGEAIYASAQEAEDQASKDALRPDESVEEDDIVDAEFEDVDDEENAA